LVLSQQGVRKGGREPKEKDMSKAHGRSPGRSTKKKKSSGKKLEHKGGSGTTSFVHRTTRESLHEKSRDSICYNIGEGGGGRRGASTKTEVLQKTWDVFSEGILGTGPWVSKPLPSVLGGPGLKERLG